MKVYGLPEGQGLGRRNDTIGPNHSGGPGSGPKAVHKPSSCPKLKFLLFLVH